MPEDFTKDIFQESLDRQHDTQLLLQELLKFFMGGDYLDTIGLKDKIVPTPPVP